MDLWMQLLYEHLTVLIKDFCFCPFCDLSNPVPAWRESLLGFDNSLAPGFVTASLSFSFSTIFRLLTTAATATATHGSQDFWFSKRLLSQMKLVYTIHNIKFPTECSLCFWVKLNFWKWLFCDTLSISAEDLGHCHALEFSGLERYSSQVYWC